MEKYNLDQMAILQVGRIPRSSTILLKVKWCCMIPHR